jgi:hypothetical protein
MELAKQVINFGYRCVVNAHLRFTQIDSYLTKMNARHSACVSGKA